MLTNKDFFSIDILSLGNNGILVFISYKPFWVVINYAVTHSVHLSAESCPLFFLPSTQHCFILSSS